jgi:hypothetical protein
LKKRTIGIALSAIILAAAFGLAGTGAASAESVMKICGDQWKQAKASGSTNGMTWKDFLAQCREQQKGAAPAAAAAAPAAAPAAAAPVVTAAAGGKTAKECNAEYAANKEAIKASGQKKKDFVEACRAGTETVPPGAAPAAAAPAPAAAPRRQRRRPRQPRRPSRRRPSRSRLRPRLRPANSRPRLRPRGNARPIRSSGSTPRAASITLPERATTARRNMAPICAKPTPRRPADALPRRKSTRKQ